MRSLVRRRYILIYIVGRISIKLLLIRRILVRIVYKCYGSNRVKPTIAITAIEAVTITTIEAVTTITIEAVTE